MKGRSSRSLARSVPLAVALLLLGGAPSAADAQRPSAEIARAEELHRRGDRETPRRIAREITRAYERDGRDWPVADRVAAGRAYVLLAPGNPDAVRRALRAFDDAAVGAADPDAALRAAGLFLDRYNAPDARAGFEAVLERWPGQPRALLGLARVLEFEGKGEALTMARRAAVADARLADAHAAMARLFLDAELVDSAHVAATRAVAADSSALDALGVLGAIAWMRGDSAALRSAESAAHRASTRPTAYFVTLAESAARQRRYAEAEAFAERAVQLDSMDVAALGALGTNRLRRGDLRSGRTVLERAFALDPFHVWHKNTLDLLDRMDGFQVTRLGRFEFVGPAREVALLTPYLSPLLEEAYEKLAIRYDYRPPTPIRFEIFDGHADFSVRTVGLTGLGALGVSFGTTLAMDAPVARERGTFNWGSTAWHELAHTFTLGLSAHRVPRWFSEGISVLEERRARPGWGAQASVEFLSALRAGRLRAVSELNEGFVRPRDPGEVVRSYFLASLVCEMIEAEWGAPVFPQMLRGWADGLSTADVFRRVLKVEESEMDSRFSAWLERRYRGLRSVPPGQVGDADLDPLLAAVESAKRRNDPTAELEAWERVMWVWPYEIDWHVAAAEAATRAGAHGKAVRERRAVLTLGPADRLEARFQLAVALRAVGDLAGARREVLGVLEEAPTFERAQRLLMEIREAARPPGGTW